MASLTCCSALLKHLWNVQKNWWCGLSGCEQKILQDVVKEYKSNGPTYRQKVYTGDAVIYVHHYRRMVPQNSDRFAPTTIHIAQ